MTAFIVLFFAQCVHTPNGGFRRGNYRCVCPPPSSSGSRRTSNSSESTEAPSGLNGVELERAYVENLLSGGIGPPVSCPGCGRVCSDALCTHERACMAEYDPLLRGIPLGVQSLSITVTIILTFVIVRLRKTKVVRPSVYIIHLVKSGTGKTSESAKPLRLCRYGILARAPIGP